MGKSLVLRDVIRKDPLFFEAIPPARRASPASVDESVRRLHEVISSLPRVSAINIPEIVDENHLGMPLYRTHEPRSFADLLRKRLEVEVVVNKVVVHLRSRGEFLGWARTSIQTHHVHNFVLVGGISHLRQYPGPSVVEACGIVNHLFRNLGVDAGLIGVVAMPARAGEAERLFAKTLAGATYATTQILFESRGIREFLSGYDALCREHGVDPVTIFLSFAPLQDSHDVDLVRWLGVDVPEELQDAILGRSHAGADPSIRIAQKLYRELQSFVKKEGLKVPLGLNVEQVSHHNLHAAMKLGGLLSRNSSR